MLTSFKKLKLLRKLGLFHYASEHKMFRKPLINIALFVLEFCLISYGYVLLHNYLSTQDVAISYTKSLYFTVISATTVGYGDHYPIHTLTQWYVIVLMIIYLPFRFFYTVGVAGFLFKIYQELKQIGRWFPMLQDHVIVYCNAKTIERNNFLWLQRFVEEKKRSLKYKDNDILLVNGNQDANEAISTFFTAHGHTLKDVHLVNANLNEENFFANIRIEYAKRVYVLADEHDISSDSNVFDMIFRIEKETDYNNGVTAELVNDRNRERIAKLGANVILRPNRSMPEMLITCTIAPGSAQMLEEISSRGGDSIERFDLPAKDFTWGDLLYELSMQGIGTATAVIYAPKQACSEQASSEQTSSEQTSSGQTSSAQASCGEHIDPNPLGTSRIHNAKAILILIHEMRTKSYAQLQEKIHSIVQNLA